MLTEIDLRHRRRMWYSGSDLIRAKQLMAATSQNTYTTLARLARAPKALEVFVSASGTVYDTWGVCIARNKCWHVHARSIPQLEPFGIGGDSKAGILSCLDAYGASAGK